MEIINLDKVSFNWQDILARLSKGRRKSSSEDMVVTAERACKEGLPALHMQSVIEVYEKIDLLDGCLVLSLGGGAKEKLLVGPRAGYLDPAEKVAVVLNTVGSGLVALMQDYSQKKDYLMMYCLDLIGVQALAEVSSNARKYVESMAEKMGCGVGPSMQPGSVNGWGVDGQSHLYRLGHGEKIGLKLNEAAFLVPHISNSAVIGLGADYSENKVGSMCHECPRREECLWRRENVE